MVVMGSPIMRQHPATLYLSYRQATVAKFCFRTMSKRSMVVMGSPLMSSPPSYLFILTLDNSSNKILLQNIENEVNGGDWLAYHEATPCNSISSL